MSMDGRISSRNAFTLIEILVVVAIIGLLVAALLPAFGTVRTRAKKVATKSQFQALDTGLEMFRSEDALGAVFPPSASDNPEDRQLIADPKGTQSDEVRIAGAQLLVHAMVGADLLGTPGFRDFDRDGLWWNDTYRDPESGGGAYSLDEDQQQMRARYGGAGYVDDKMRQNTKSLGDLEDEGSILNLDDAQGDIARDELFFIDPWGAPILYYKANRAASRMVAEEDTSGIYRQEDNGIITGTEGTDNPGIDFGPGQVDTDRYHEIYEIPDQGSDDNWEDILNNDKYDGSFVRFILDSSVRARPTPVRKDTYLLISAGPDSIYGTDDDVTNWTREKR